jgi:hypothetical protein
MKEGTMASDLLKSDKIARLEIGLEESTRATAETAARFVEPAAGTLARALSNRHHLLFGRRGSGKTSLLLKARTDLVMNRRPNAFVDMEKFKGHSYPDVLISVLIETCENLRSWLDEGAIAPASKTSFWRRLLGRPARQPLNRVEALSLSERIKEYVDELNQLLHAQDGAEIETLKRDGRTLRDAAQISGGVASGPLQASGELSRESASENSAEVRESLKRSKTDYLYRRVIDYQALLRDLVRLSGEDGFLLLDDFYQIPRSTQADVLDYFHRSVKGTGLWLKVGTIRHRTTWYRHGDPPIGMKLGDDVDEIDLDVTLEKYQTAKGFLISILQRLAEEFDVSVRELLTDGARDRLVLASGGVARDFLSILRKSIGFARERGESRVGAESVNQAAGEHEATKRDEFRRDVLEGVDTLESEFDRIKKFCLEDQKVNCFLVEKDLQGDGYLNVKELVDLRLLHAIASRVTVRNRPGRIFEGYMVDVSQYTGERKRRGLDLLEFWKRDEQEKLRRTSLIYLEARTQV